MTDLVPPSVLKRTLLISKSSSLSGDRIHLILLQLPSSRLQILCGFRDQVIKSNLAMRAERVLVSGRRTRRVNLDELIHHEKGGRG